MSRSLTAKATRGFLKVGDLLVPGGDGLPSFSESGLITNAHRMLDYVPEGDRKGLIGLAEALARLPRWALRALFWACDRADRFPGPAASLLRQVDLGLKGFVYTLYYSDPAVRRKLGWTAHVQRPGET
jgi:hypothetical protein